MSEPEGEDDAAANYVSEQHLLSLLPPAPSGGGEEPPEVQLAYLRGQLDMVAVYRERDDLREKVRTLSAQNMELHGRLKAQYPLVREEVEREVGQKYRITEEEVDGAAADTLRELDQYMYSKRGCVLPHISDDLQRVVRNGNERMRVILRRSKQ